MTLNVKVDSLMQGAQNAQGTAVMVDIFRATTQIATLLEMGASKIYPAVGIDEGRSLKKKLEKTNQEKVYLSGEADT